MTAPKVFVSYAHESPQHRNDVLAFAGFLRGQGVDAVLDVWSAQARHDWYAWAIREMTAAAYVIVVASPAYRAVGDGAAPADRHRGVQSEATLLRDLVYGDRDTWTPKVLPVLLPGHKIDEIPYFLSPYTTSRFTVAAYTVTGAEELLRVIHRRPGHLPPPVLPPPDLPPHPAPVAVVWCAGMPVNHDPEDVEVHLVPGEPLDPLESEDMRRALSELDDAGVVQVDAAGSTAWNAEDDAGMALLRTGQRSIWFETSHPFDESDLMGNLAACVEVLAGFDLPCPAEWVPAIGAGSIRITLPRVASRDLRPVSLAARLASALLAEMRPVPRTTHVTNTNSGNANVVIQAGEIHGGMHTSG